MSGAPLALLGIYVDDLLIAGPEAEAEALLGGIKATWTCSAEQRLSKKPITFCGLEIERNQGSGALNVHQSSYIGELESRHGPLVASSLPTFKDEEEELNPAGHEIKTAQGLTGELTWVACRSRPDIASSVSRVARMLSKRPAAAIKAAKQIIGYLISTRGYSVCYGGEGDGEFKMHLIHNRSIKLVESFSDASFGCESGRSQSGVMVLFGGCPVGWLSLTQPFTTLSTCESELIASCEALTLAQALLPLWREISGEQPVWIHYTDSVPCASVLMFPSGSWRTKHLRLRSRAFRELIENEELVLTHIAGKWQLADCLTKALARVRMAELLRYLDYGGLPGSEEPSQEQSESAHVRFCGSGFEWATPGTGGVGSTLQIAMLALLPWTAQAQGNEPAWISQSRWLWAFMGLFVILAVMLWSWYWPFRTSWKLLRLVRVAELIHQEEPALHQHPPPVSLRVLGSSPHFSPRVLGSSPHLSPDMVSSPHSLSSEQASTAFEGAQPLEQDEQANANAVSQGVSLMPGFFTADLEDAEIDRTSLAEYLERMGLAHLLTFLLEYGVEVLSDLRYLYVEDLVEAGFNLEEVRLLFQPFPAHDHRRPEGPFRTGSRSQEVPLIVQGGKLAWTGIRGRLITWTPPAGGAPGDPLLRIHIIKLGHLETLHLNP